MYSLNFTPASFGLQSCGGHAKKRRLNTVGLDYYEKPVNMRGGKA
jgi:hypothetical protein